MHPGVAGAAMAVWVSRHRTMRGLDTGTASTTRPAIRSSSSNASRPSGRSRARRLRSCQARQCPIACPRHNASDGPAAHRCPAMGFASGCQGLLLPRTPFNKKAITRTATISPMGPIPQPAPIPQYRPPPPPNSTNSTINTMSRSIVLSSWWLECLERHRNTRKSTQSLRQHWSR